MAKVLWYGPRALWYGLSRTTGQRALYLGIWGYVRSTCHTVVGMHMVNGKFQHRAMPLVGFRSMPLYSGCTIIHSLCFMRRLLLVKQKTRHPKP